MTQESSKPAPQHLSALHALRGFGILLILGFHFLGVVHQHDIAAHTLDKNALDYRIFSGSHVGTILLFYLSGFMIPYTVRLSSSVTATHFLIKRLCRVFPAFLICYLVYVSAVRPDFSALEFLKGAVLIPARNSPHMLYDFNPLPVAWTLSYEVMFYLIFAACMKLTARKAQLPWLICASILLCVVGVQLSVTGHVTFDAVASPNLPGQGVLATLGGILANPIMLTIVVGIASSELFHYLQHEVVRVPPRLYRAAAAALGVAAGTLYWNLRITYDYFSIWSFIIAGMVLLFGMLSDLSKEPVRIRFVAWLGDISYGVFLIHIIVIDAVNTYWPGWWMHHNVLLEFVGLLSVTFTASWLLYRHVERPAMRYAQQIINQLKAAKKPVLSEAAPLYDAPPK